MYQRVLHVHCTLGFQRNCLTFVQRGAFWEHQCSAPDYTYFLWNELSNHCCIPQTNVILYVKYISILKRETNLMTCLKHYTKLIFQAEALGTPPVDLALPCALEPAASTGRSLRNSGFLASPGVLFWLCTILHQSCCSTLLACNPVQFLL